MCLARDGGRERESLAWSALVGVCERNTFVERVGGTGVVYLRELEIETWRERMSVCQKLIAIVRWLGG
jgi:hypothetical protein